MKRNNRNIFGLFVFWNAAIKGKQLKRKKERKKENCNMDIQSIDKI